MSIRVTQSMMHAQLYRNINNNLGNLRDLENQTATGKKLNKASDDPVGMTFALRYRAELSDNTQYQKNVDSAISQLDYYDTVLGQATQVVTRLKDLAVQASSGTQEQLGLDSIKNEIEQLKKQLVDVGNSTFNGKYIFNGQNTTEKLFAEGVSPSTVEGNLDKIEYTISTGTRIDVNIKSNQVFGEKNATDNIFVVIENISSALAAGNHGDVADQLKNIEAGMDRIIGARAVVGARTNRLELMQNRLDDSEINLTGMQSQAEDADYAKLLIDAQISENIYQASLSVGSKIIQKSLVDFLR